MSATDSITPEPHRFSIPLPRPKRILAAAAAFALGYAGLRIGVPVHQRRVAIREIKHFTGSVQYLHRPAWGFEWLGEDRMQWLDDPDHVVFWPDEANLSRRSRFGGAILEITCPQIDDENLKCVLGLPNLKSLDLAFSSVGDGGVKYLSGLRKLEKLRLTGSDVSDLSVPLLSRMQTLEELDVLDTKITKSGGRRLQAALPKCNVRGPHNDRWGLGL